MRLLSHACVIVVIYLTFLNTIFRSAYHFLHIHILHIRMSINTHTQIRVVCTYTLWRSGNFFPFTFTSVKYRLCNSSRCGVWARVIYRRRVFRCIFYNLKKTASKIVFYPCNIITKMKSFHDVTIISNEFCILIQFYVHELMMPVVEIIIY